MNEGAGRLNRKWGPESGKGSKAREAEQEAGARKLNRRKGGWTGLDALDHRK